MVEAISPEQRVIKAVNQNEATASQSKSEASTLKGKASQASEDAAAIRRIQTELQTQIDDTQGIQEARGKIKKLKAKVSGKTKQEQAQLDKLLKQLDEKGSETGEKEKQQSVAESGATKAEKTSRHAETVAESNKRNVSKEKEKTKPWEERTVPINASSELTKALEEQDALTLDGFEKAAVKILGRERVLGSSVYNVIEEAYKRKTNSKKRIKFLFPKTKPSLDSLTRLTSDKTLVLVPSELEISKQVLTTEGVKTEVENRPITLSNLRTLFPELFEKQSTNVTDYENEPIANGWMVEQQYKYIRDDAAAKIEDLPSPQYYYLSYLRDYLSKRKNSSYLESPETDDLINSVFCHTKEGLVIAIGGSKITRDRGQPNIFFTSSGLGFAFGKAIKTTPLE